MNRNDAKTSKFLSLILRHEPGVVGLALDENGWVTVDALLAALARNSRDLSRADLQRIVDQNDKKRFAFSEDGERIRASQGHSVEVDLNLQSQCPPEILYHGTVEPFLASIWKEGIRKGSRHHVHLSADSRTASKVGERRGRPVILKIEAGRMHRSGLHFYQSANGVWLADAVPVEFIQFPNL